MNRSIIPLGILGAETLAFSVLFPINAVDVRPSLYPYLWLLPWFGWVLNDGWVNAGAVLAAALGCGYVFRGRGSRWAWWLLAAVNLLPMAISSVLPLFGIWGIGDSVIAATALASATALTWKSRRLPDLLLFLGALIAITLLYWSPPHWLPLFLGSTLTYWLRGRFLFPGSLT